MPSTIAGATTIRGVDQQSRFQNKCKELMDWFSRPKFHMSGAQEWLCLRLDFLSSLTFACSLVFLISVPPGSFMNSTFILLPKFNYDTQSIKLIFIMGTLNMLVIAKRVGAMEPVTFAAIILGLFVVLMLLFAWLSAKPGNAAIYYPNRILKNMDPWEGAGSGRQTHYPFARMKEALTSKESEIIAMSAVATAMYFVYMTTGARRRANQSKNGEGENQRRKLRRIGFCLAIIQGVEQFGAEEDESCCALRIHPSHHRRRHEFRAQTSALPAREGSLVGRG